MNLDFESALNAELETIAALNRRVYPLFAPEATAKSGVPYAIYASSDGQRDKSLGGYLDSKMVRGEVNIIAATYAQMKSIANQAVDLLVSMEQRTIGSGGPFIEELVYETPVELFEERPNLYRTLIEFRAYFSEGG